MNGYQGISRNFQANFLFFEAPLTFDSSFQLFILSFKKPAKTETATSAGRTCVTQILPLLVDLIDDVIGSKQKQSGAMQSRRR